MYMYVSRRGFSYPVKAHTYTPEEEKLTVIIDLSKFEVDEVVKQEYFGISEDDYDLCVLTSTFDHATLNDLHDLYHAKKGQKLHDLPRRI